MPILLVNPSSRRKKRYRVSGRAKVGKANPRKRRGKMPKALAAYWKKKRRKSRRSPAKKRRGGSHKKRKSTMAKRKRRRARRGKRRTKRRSRRRSRKRAGGKRRRRRSRKRSTGGKRRRRRGRKRAGGKRRRRRRGRKRAGGKRRRARRRKGGKRRRRRSTGRTKTVKMRYTPGGTLIMNPRRRRRRRRSSKRRGRRRAARRYSRGRYRRNPGGMLIDLAKRAAPVLVGLYGARLLVSKLGPRIPGVSRLGALQSPLLAVGAVLAVNFATKKIGKLAKYRSELLLGTGLNLVDSLISAFAPAGLKAAIGVGDVYDRALGEYIHYGSGIPAEDPAQAMMGEYVQMGEYVAVGDVEEELGAVEEELGLVEEELGDQSSWGQGVANSAMMRPVPRQAMLAPVPTRSYTRGVEAATAAWDSPRDFYQGIFAGGAAGSAWQPGE